MLVIGVQGKLELQTKPLGIMCTLQRINHDKNNGIVVDNGFVFSFGC